MGAVMGYNGIAKEIVGNPLCWYNQWKYVRSEQAADCRDRILRKFCMKRKEWSVLFWSDKYIQKSLDRFAKYCKLERAVQRA